MGLSTTAMMQAHLGSRGGSAMLEHFEDLASAGKMDGTTLRAGFNSEINYMREKAADPNPPNYTSSGKAGQTAFSNTQQQQQQTTGPKYSRPKPNVVVEQ
jgi:hypothetical protein